MSKFNDLFSKVITEMNINLAKEVVCKPDTMLNQSELNSKKINRERKPTVKVKSAGNTTSITYTVDTDDSATMMADNIKANGGAASTTKSSGISKECNANNNTDNNTEVVNEDDTFAISDEFNKEKYEQFLAEGKQLGIDAVTQYLNEHSAELSDDFSFNRAPEEEYFVEYALLRYNEEEDAELPEEEI